MRIISTPLLLEFYERHAEAKPALLAWAQAIKDLEIENLNDLHFNFQAKVLPNNRVIFKIKGNQFRIVTVVKIKGQRVYLRWFGTHADYDKIDANSV